MSQKEVIKSRIRALVERMRKMRIEYSACEDQLSDLSSDLMEIERKEEDRAKDKSDNG